MIPLPTLRQLGYLVALADRGHFGRAASACFVTQSTLSAGLQELERHLGVQLVERTRRQVLLTPVGEEVTRRARELLRGAEELVALAQGSAEPLSGLLRLGVIPTIGPYLLPRTLPMLRKAYPRLKLHLREDLTERLLTRLNEGELDAVLLATPWPLSRFEAVRLGDDPFELVHPAGHPLGRAGRLGLDELPANELLLLEDGHCLRGHVLEACKLSERQTNERLQATSLATLVQMVANGFGVTLVPRMAIASRMLEQTGLVARPMPGASREITLAWRRSFPRSAELRLLAESMRSAMAEPMDKPSKPPAPGRIASGHTGRERSR